MILANLSASTFKDVWRMGMGMYFLTIWLTESMTLSLILMMLLLSEMRK